MNKYQIKSRNDVNNLLHEFSSHELRLLKHEFGSISDDALITSILEYEDIKNQETIDSTHYDMIAISSRLHDILENICDDMKSAKIRKHRCNMTKEFDDTKIAKMVQGFRKAGMTSEEINQAVNAIQVNSKLIVPTKPTKPLEVQTKEMVSKVVHEFTGVKLEILKEYFMNLSFKKMDKDEATSSLIDIVTDIPNVLSFDNADYDEAYEDEPKYLYNEDAIRARFNIIINETASALAKFYPEMPLAMAYDYERNQIATNSNNDTQLLKDALIAAHSFHRGVKVTIINDDVSVEHDTITLDDVTDELTYDLNKQKMQLYVKVKFKNGNHYNIPVVVYKESHYFFLFTIYDCKLHSAI